MPRLWCAHRRLRQGLVLLVMLLALYSSLPSGQAAWHLGRYGPEGQLRRARRRHWFRCFRAVFSLFVGRDRVVRCPFAQRHALCRCCVWCSLPDSAVNCGVSTGAVLGRRYCHCDRCRVVQVAPKTIEIPQFIDKVADFPVVRVVQILRCRCAEDIRAPTVAAR